MAPGDGHNRSCLRTSRAKMSATPREVAHWLLSVHSTVLELSHEGALESFEPYATVPENARGAGNS